MKMAVRIMLAIALIIMLMILNACSGGGRFVVKSSETVLDTQTNLMWASKDNGSDISWEGAKSHCENYRGGGFKDWRMPTQDELAGLYDANKNRPAPCYGSFDIHVATELINITCFAPWASETRDSDAAQFHFVHGTKFWYLQKHTYGTRALPVRSAK